MSRRDEQRSVVPRKWKVAGAEIEFGDLPLMMGIINVTPDSFSDGGKFIASEAALEQAKKLVDEGADLLDIGGESTRPGSEQVVLEEELRRTVPAIEKIAAKLDVPISIDTTKAEVARQALRAGACIVNDISGLTFDAEMRTVCAESGAGVVCMHIQGTPQTMQDNPTYEDVVHDIRVWLRERVAALTAVGISEEQIVLDPGIGFGKTAEHNLEILSHVKELQAIGFPLLVGHSRKRFLGAILDRPLDERTFGTVGVSVALAAQGAEIIRVHDVAASRDAIVAYRAVMGQG